MITVVQNYICTCNKRLDVLLNNLPKLGEVFRDIPFLVNFNDSINLDIIHNSYKKNIKKLNFYNNLEKDWALVTLSLLEEVQTPYLLYLCEDQILHSTYEELNNILDEIKRLDIDFTNLTKINKYSSNTFPGYIEHNYGYSYKGKNSPTGRFEGYYDHSIGIRKFQNLKCYIPKQPIFVEYTDTLQKHTYV